MCVVYFRSDCLALRRCLEVQTLWLISASSWKALAHMLDPRPSGLTAITRDNTVESGGECDNSGLSPSYQAEWGPPADHIRRPQISNTSANSSYTLQGKTWTEGPSLENTCHQKSCDQLQESCYIHTRRNAEGEVSTTAPRYSAAVFPTGWKHTRTCHCLLKLKKALG